MPILLHRSHRLEILADLLAGLLRANPPPDPITPQTVVVGSRGMERWLRAHLAQAHGICANIEFIFPAKALARMVDPLAGPRPDPDPWSPDALAWTILDLLPDIAEHPDLEPVRRWLEGDQEPVSRRRYGLARELADVLDRYHMARPDLIQTFKAGEPVSDPTAAWQGTLWRTCREHLDSPCPTERASTAASALRQGAKVDLHELYLFGISALPPLWLELLGAAGTQLSLHLLLFSPSEAWWGDFLTPHEARRLARRGPRGAEFADQALAEQHPLLTSLGRLSRDMQGLLTEHLSDAAEPAAQALRIDPDPSCALHHLQADLRALALPDTPRPLDPSDRSIQIHACAGPARQAHALRDALLHLFSQDRTLEPRDVVVLTPDIDTFGPLVQGALEQGGRWPSDPAWHEAGGPRLRCTVSDSPLRAGNLCAEALLGLLRMADGRLSAPELFALARLDPVARRFALSADDLGVLRSWIDGAGFRWGLDATDRAQHQQPADLQNTLRFALRRLALGVLEADEGVLLPAGSDPPVSPHDDLEGHDVVLFGRFARFADTVERHVRALRGARPMADHLRAIHQAFKDLVAPDPARRAPYERVLESLQEVGQRASTFERPVRIAAVRHLLTHHFDDSRHDDRPITGAITVSALTPMRSVPFRVVCLIGLDEGTFPRQSTRPSWDLVASQPRAGDRDLRDEDRHLLLESIFAARDHLVITCTARDAQRGVEVPFSPPIAELLDALDATFCTRQGGLAQPQILHHHPLQPTAPRTFEGSHPSFDARAARLLAALHGERRPIRAFPTGTSLPYEPPEALSVHELAAALAHPQRALCRAMRLRTPDQSTTPAEREPMGVSGLERWFILTEGLAHPAAIPQQGTLIDRLRAQGRVQPGRAGSRQSRALHEELTALDRARRQFLELPREVRVELELPSGRKILGDLRALGPQGPVLVSPSAPSNLRSQMRCWVALLALASAGEGERAVLIGTERRTLAATALTAPETPLSLLDELVKTYDLIQSTPALLLPNLSAELVEHLLAQGDPDDLGSVDAEAWEPTLRGLAMRGWGTPQEPGADRSDPHVRMILGDDPPFLTEHGRLEPSVIRLALKVWGPLLTHRSAISIEGVP
ncbi:MAG: exodeoxyribonuclease V subunit gamma [Deltaproteobacteria bacterium]|nr:MAG: exodeoxyribonuclease V subunit gamma [Deltaproteobacteria bacterium]